MSMKAGKKSDVIEFANMTGGINLNDPAISLSDNQVAGAINARFLKQGFDRWPGAVNLTEKAAVDDYLRGMDHHALIDGTQYLYEMHGGKLYSVNKSTGGLTEVYDAGGDGEAWGGSHYGTYYCANGTGVFKAEGTTGSRVGIAAPTGVTAVAATSGGNLPDGVYALYASYARVVGGIDVLYSKGQLIASVTISGGSGSGKITISNFANSADSQVGNKVIWMTRADDSTFYKWADTDDNTTTTFDVTTLDPDSTAITYSAFAKNNDLPGAFTFLFCFNNRVWGIIGNRVYYSLKASGSKYNLERFPANNYIEYPYQANGLFSVGKHLCVNTVKNGVIVQPMADVGAIYEHYEEEDSFKYMRTVGNWNGDVIGLCFDRVGVFSKDTFTFREWDYGYNIRPVLDRVWGSDDTDFIPCGVVYRRNNRIEYQLSIRDTNVNAVANNRVWCLNLSRVYFESIDNSRTPWEMIARGYNYVTVDNDNAIFYGQSFNASSTIYKELKTASTEIGIYNDSGVYLDAVANMPIQVTTRTINENLFTTTIIENIRALMQINFDIGIKLSIVDDPSLVISQETTGGADSQSLWDAFNWADDSGNGGKWAAEYQQMYQFKGKMGVNGYLWNLVFSQTANDINMKITKFDILVTLETGRGI